MSNIIDQFIQAAQANPMVQDIGSDINKAGSDIVSGAQNLGNSIGQVAQNFTPQGMATTLQNVASGKVVPQFQAMADVAGGPGEGIPAEPTVESPTILDAQGNPIPRSGAVGLKTAKQIQAEKAAGAGPQINPGFQSQENPAPLPDASLKTGTESLPPVSGPMPGEKAPGLATEAVKPVPKTPKPPLPGGNASDIPQSAVDMFNDKYTVPNKTAQGLLRAQQTARGMLAHVKSGMDITKIEPLANQAVQNVSNITRNTIDNITAPIQPGDPAGAAKAILDSHKTMVNPDTAKDILSDIRAGQPETQDADAMFGWVKDLEGRAAMAKQSNTYLTYRGDAAIIAKAFTAASREIMENIDNNSADALAAAKTPERIAQLTALSPRLGQEVQYAENVSQVRSAIKDFTPFSKIVDSTQNSANSVFGKVGRGMQQELNPDDFVRWATNPQGSALKWGLGKVAGAFQKSDVDTLMKELKKKPEDMPTSRFTGKSVVPNADTARPSGLKTLAGIGALGGLSVAAHMLAPKNTNTYGQEPTGENQGINSKHGLSVAQNGINVNTLSPQSFSAIKPDPKTGLWDLPRNPSAGTRTYMSETDYNNGLAAISAKYPAGSQDPHYTVAKTLLDQQYNTDQEQAKQVFQGNNIQNFMDNTTTYNSDGNRLLGTLGSLPTGFWNGVTQAGSVRAYTDQTYTQELQQIDNFDNEFASAYKSVTGNDPSANQLIQSANSPRQAAVKFTSMMQFVNGTYGKYLSPYLAITSATGSQTTQGNPQSFNFPTQSNPGGLPAPAPQSNPSTVNIGGGSPPAWSPQ